MKIHSLIPIAIVLFALHFNLFAQECVSSLSSDKINFETVKTNKMFRKGLWIKNLNAITPKVRVESTKILQGYDAYSIVSYPSEFIRANDSSYIEIEINASQNIDYKAILIVNIDCGGSRYALAAEIFAKAEFDNQYYVSTQNLWGNELKTALNNLIKGHKSLSYKDARTLMWSSFDNVGGFVECVYTGRKVETDVIPNTSEKPFDTEHTWPQAFGADFEPEKSDMFHFFPTWQTANSRRGNTRFDYVVSATPIWQDGGSKLGADANNALAFEPRDVHKGNVARAMFYFATRYGNKENFLTNQETTLRKWMTVDPVDSREMNRNDSIFAYQKNRNPFIDYPEFLDRIKSISTDEDVPQVYDVNLSSDEIVFNLFRKQNEIKYYIYNIGNTKAVLKDARIENDATGAFSLKYTISDLMPNKEEMKSFTIACSKENSNANMILEYDDDSKKIVKLSSISDDVSVEDVNSVETVAFPNPFSENITISFDKSSAISDVAEISIYDAGSNLINRLSKEINSNSIQLSKSDFANTGNKVYFVHIKNATNLIIKKVILN